ncbi:MAG: SRPBCC family protein [Dehalococcoidia bacterium]
MTPDRGGVVEQTIRIAARPEIVFDLLVDARQMLRWQGIEAEADPRPGGLYRVRMNALGHTIRGRFVEVTPHTRVVYTWGWEVGELPVPAESSTVEITLTRDGAGTVLHLLHHGLPDLEEVTSAHGGGWARYLGRLSAIAEGRDPGPDEWATGVMAGV